ncbi:MAG: DNA polymerase III subunit gamma/tau [Firmicutes bacterium]|nr:DNA polymerase III subunit gamma/tau [Bacillota bacterium]
MYLNLYRKFRPKRFEDVLGQEYIVKALSNQVLLGRVSHAYLFTGTRGTGKTSLAKIFALAVNCESVSRKPKQTLLPPCYKCATCIALTTSSENLDIIELDAASRRSINDVREILESVKYPPVVASKKVYIIDEAHMLTTEAFNAFLKTLEEPPPYAIFILATTESHKLPQTILSRCMRLDFKLIPTDKIQTLLGGIFAQMGIEAESGAIELIARAGEGSVRDALSIAETAISVEQVVTYKTVAEFLGAVDKQFIYTLALHILKKDAGSALEIANKLFAEGKSVTLLVKDLLEIFAQIVLEVSGGAGSQKTLTAQQFLTDIIKKAKPSVTRLTYLMEVFSKTEASLRFATNANIVLQTAIIKGASPSVVDEIESVFARLEQLEQTAGSGNTATSEQHISGQRPANSGQGEADNLSSKATQKTSHSSQHIPQVIISDGISEELEKRIKDLETIAKQRDASCERSLNSRLESLQYLENLIDRVTKLENKNAKALPAVIKNPKAEKPKAEPKVKVEKPKKVKEPKVKAEKPKPEKKPKVEKPKPIKEAKVKTEKPKKEAKPKPEKPKKEPKVKTEAKPKEVKPKAEPKPKVPKAVKEPKPKVEKPKAPKVEKPKPVKEVKPKTEKPKAENPHRSSLIAHPLPNSQLSTRGSQLQKPTPQKEDIKKGKAIWGGVVTALREGGHTILMGVVTNVQDAYVSGNKLIAKVTETEFTRLNTPENLQIINSILSKHNLTVEYTHTSTKNTALENMKELFGDNLKLR